LPGFFHALVAVAKVEPGVDQPGGAGAAADGGDFFYPQAINVKNPCQRAASAAWREIMLYN
jgi:hypothetical protein